MDHAIRIDDFEYDVNYVGGEFSSSGRVLRSTYKLKSNINSRTNEKETVDEDKDLQMAIQLSLNQQPFAGLINHGATCYLNSLLQCLFVISTLICIFI